MNSERLAKYFLRIGLAFVFIYASVEIYLSPDNFLKYVPNQLLDMIPLDTFLIVFGIAEIALAVWLISGWKGHYPSFLSFLMMAGIVAFNMEYFQVLFRNVAIGFGSLALVVLELNHQKSIDAASIVRNKLKRITLVDKELFQPKFLTEMLA